MKDLKLGLQLGYWGGGPNPNMIPMVQEAERLGYDAVCCIRCDETHFSRSADQRGLL